MVSRFRFGWGFGLFLLLLLSVAATPVSAQTVGRSVDEFLAAQGTFCLDDGSGGCLLFVPPLPNFFGWSQPAINRCAAIDYAGIANTWLKAHGRDLGTKIEGTITERPMGNGQAEISVLLHTSNALAWAIDQCADFSAPNLIFGSRAPDVLAGATPALAESFFKVVFLTRPNAPLPDILQVAFAPEPGQSLLFLGGNAHSEGKLRAAFGVPEGTTGRLTIVQTGLFITPFMGAVGDGFPAEYVTLKVIGSRRAPVQTLE